MNAAELVVELTTTLESHGLQRSDYDLEDEIDPEALARVIESGSGSVFVHLSIRGLPLVVSAYGVHLIGSSRPPVRRSELSDSRRSE